jgi:hypothetical protein
MVPAIMTAAIDSRTRSRTKMDAACRGPRGPLRHSLYVIYGGKQVFLVWNRRKPLKGLDLDEGIQGNPRIFFLVFLGFLWSCLVWLGSAWKNLD